MPEEGSTPVSQIVDHRDHLSANIAGKPSPFSLTRDRICPCIRRCNRIWRQLLQAEPTLQNPVSVLVIHEQVHTSSRLVQLFPAVSLGKLRHQTHLVGRIGVA